MLDIEEEILGICLTTIDAIAEARTMLPTAEPFGSLDFQRVYTTMLQLHSDRLETDLVTVNFHLTRQFGVNSSAKTPWMNLLTSLLPAAKRARGNLAHKAVILQQEGVRRAFGEQLSRLLVECQSPLNDPLQLLDQMGRWIDGQRNTLTELSDSPFSSALIDAVERAEKAAKSGNSITGIATGLSELDRYLKGLQPATFTVMAARPGAGKTAEACQIAYNVAYEQRIPVAFFSLEMNRLQLARRMLAIDTGIKNSQVTGGLDSFGQPISITRLYDSAGKLSDAPLYVFDKVRSLPQLKAKCSQLINRYGVGLIVVDYLQLIKTGTRMDDNPVARVTEVSRELKEISTNHEVAVLALAQLSREVEKRAGNRPQLSDLRESGAIEQDADNIVFLLRPGYYAKTDAQGSAIDDNLLLNIVAKNRNGSTHSGDEGIALFYDRSTNQIIDFRASSHLSETPAF